MERKNFEILEREREWSGEFFKCWSGSGSGAGIFIIVGAGAGVERVNLLLSMPERFSPSFLT